MTLPLFSASVISRCRRRFSFAALFSMPRQLLLCHYLFLQPAELQLLFSLRLPDVFLQMPAPARHAASDADAAAPLMLSCRWLLILPAFFAGFFHVDISLSMPFSPCHAIADFHIFAPRARAQRRAPLYFHYVFIRQLDYAAASALMLTP